MKLSSSNNIIGAVIFKSDFPDGGGTVPSNMTYSIRLSYSMRNVDQNSYVTQWMTQSLFPFYQVPGPREKEDAYGGLPGKSLNRDNMVDPCDLNNFVDISQSFIVSKY